MLRNVFCEQIAAGGMSTVIDESTCTGEKPEAQKACSEDDDESDSMSAPKVSTVFPHIVSAETILFWIWKFKGHST